VINIDGGFIHICAVDVYSLLLSADREAERSFLKVPSVEKAKAAHLGIDGFSANFG
jgi:hypothetical protein